MRRLGSDESAPDEGGEQGSDNGQKDLDGNRSSRLPAPVGKTGQSAELYQEPHSKVDGLHVCSLPAPRSLCVGQ